MAPAVAKRGVGKGNLCFLTKAEAAERRSIRGFLNDQPVTKTPGPFSPGSKYLGSNSSVAIPPVGPIPHRESF